MGTGDAGAEHQHLNAIQHADISIVAEVEQSASLLHPLCNLTQPNSILAVYHGNLRAKTQ
jgi:hypothetical protein